MLLCTRTWCMELSYMLIHMLLTWISWLRLINKLLRILQNQPIATSVSQFYIYTSFNLLSIDTLHVLQILLLVFKCLYHSGLVPSIYSNYFMLNNEIHNYNTRLSQGLHICGPRTSFGQKCIQFKGSSLWNRFKLKIPSSKKNLKIIWVQCNLVVWHV